MDIAKGTGKVSDLLEVEARIADVRGQIEQLDGQRARSSQDQVAYGTLVATFGTEVVQVQETAKGWDPTSGRRRRDGDADRRRPVDRLGGRSGSRIVWLPVILVLLVSRADRPLGVPPVPAEAQGRSEPVPGWGGGELTATRIRADREAVPCTVSQAASAARARSRVRFQAGQPWSDGSVRSCSSRHASAGASASRSAWPSAVPRVHDRDDRLVAQRDEVVRVEPGAAARRHERRVDRPLQVPLRHERLRADDVQADDRDEDDDPERVQGPAGAARAAGGPRSRRAPRRASAIETRTTRRSSVHPYIDW